MIAFIKVNLEKIHLGLFSREKFQKTIVEKSNKLNGQINPKEKFCTPNFVNLTEITKKKRSWKFPDIPDGFWAIRRKNNFFEKKKFFGHVIQLW